VTEKWPEKTRIHITDPMIDAAKGCSPTACGIHLATKKAIGGHGYVHVDASGVSITRRDDYREKAFLTRPLTRWMIAFDKWTRSAGPRPKPMSATLTFFKTSKIVKRDRDEINRAREARKANGWKEKKYNIHERIVGLVG
jgi:hypothetical protein